jgi:hypothetical protein
MRNAVVLAAGLAVAPLASAQFFENFDSYPLGAMGMVNGWDVWDGTGSPGVVTDAQSLSPKQSLEINGFDDQVKDLGGHGSGVWHLSANQYMPGNFTGQTFFIVLNDYNKGGAKDWALQMLFTSTTVSDLDRGGSLPVIKDKWVTVDLFVDLDNDKMELYYGGNLVSSGVFTSQGSGGGLKNLDTLDLFSNNGSTVYWDDVGLVPAPGAMALLGLGGLLASRRRR